MFSPPPSIVGCGGMTRVEAFIPPPAVYSSRDPLFIGENLLWEPPVGLSSRSAYECRAWTLQSKLGRLNSLSLRNTDRQMTDKCQLDYLVACLEDPWHLAFSFQSGYLCIWSHFEQQEKACQKENQKHVKKHVIAGESSVKSRILYSIYNLQKVRGLAVLCFSPSWKKQRKENLCRRLIMSKDWGIWGWVVFWLFGVFLGWYCQMADAILPVSLWNWKT